MSWSGNRVGVRGFGSGLLRGVGGLRAGNAMVREGSLMMVVVGGVRCGFRGLWGGSELCGTGMCIGESRYSSLSLWLEESLLGRLFCPFL